MISHGTILAGLDILLICCGSIDSTLLLEAEFNLRSVLVEQQANEIGVDDVTLARDHLLVAGQCARYALLTNSACVFVVARRLPTTDTPPRSATTVTSTDAVVFSSAGVDALPLHM